jgi:UDPglucose--hexose-1-phosphate uridylyltransferase
MTDATIMIDRLKNGSIIHKRTHIKPDGRNLFLYGRSEHTLPVVTGEELSKSTGSELRQHPLRGDWSVYAAKRQNRTFKPSSAENPLAPSRNGQALTEIPFEDFELAVFENRFPSFHVAADIPEEMRCVSKAAEGACEVIVYSPDPSGSMATLGQDKRRLLLEAWIDRYIALYDQGCAFVLPFENRGEEVGVTLHHPHGQIYGFPIIPTPQANAVKAFENGYDLAKEMKSWDTLQINNAGGVRAYAPPFARFPYEVWISADVPIAGPWDFNIEQSDGFCHLLGDITARYDAFFGQTTPYMLSLHAAPYGKSDTFQFTAQFYPLLRAPGRLKYLAAVEQSTGIFTVDVMPEQTAQVLRDIL